MEIAVMRLTLTTAADYIDFVERRYFSAVRDGDVTSVLAHFAPGATLTGYMGTAPSRIFRHEPGLGEESLDAFMAAARDFYLTYRDFVHVVDCDAKRVSSRFTLLMVPRANGTKSSMSPRRMQNCNFFQFSDGLLSEVVAFFSNPDEAVP
jgi:ketosteroid isomerase-like protein